MWFAKATTRPVMPASILLSFCPVIGWNMQPASNWLELFLAQYIFPYLQNQSLTKSVLGYKR